MAEDTMGVADSASVRKIPADASDEQTDGPSRRAWAKLAILSAFALLGVWRAVEILFHFANALL